MLRAPGIWVLCPSRVSGDRFQNICAVILLVKTSPAFFCVQRGVPLFPLPLIAERFAIDGVLVVNGGFAR